jgi:hypothetical protein
MLLNWFVPNKKNGYSPYLLRSTALSVYTLLLLIFNILGGTVGLGTVQASTITKSNIIQLTNVERQKYGLTTLRENARLNSAALAKANNMLEQQYWDHFGPNGETPWQFIKSAGYTYIFAGENLAKGFKSSEGVVQAWMASPTHRENILSGNYVDIGVAVIDGVLQGESVTLVVQMFGNTTSNTTPSAPATPKPVEKPIEQGEIKSISITYPVEGTTVNDPGFTVKGAVVNVKGEYTVDILDKERILGNLSTNGELWEFSRNSDWSEGEHKVTAELVGEDPKVSDVVSFNIDSVPPQIEDSDITVIESGEGWKVEVKTAEENPDITIVVGSKTYASSFIEGVYVISLGKVEGNEKVILVASDRYGNTVEIEITDRFDEGEANGSVLGGFLGSISIKDTVNTMFVLFIFILLLIEITVYVRKGMVKEKRGSLFSMGMWWMLLLIGTLNGFGGSII